MKTTLLLSRKGIILTVILLILWITAAWFIAKVRYDNRALKLVHEEIQGIQDDEDDIAYNVKWNLKYLHGIPHSLAGDDAIRKTLSTFGSDLTPPALPTEKKKQKWENDPALKNLDQWLALSVKSFGTDIIWVINSSGDCIASSNASGPASFVGTNYADRDYYRLPKGGRDGMQYAFGRVSNKPGLFFSSPVMVDNRFVDPGAACCGYTGFPHPKPGPPAKARPTRRISPGLPGLSGP